MKICQLCKVELSMQFAYLFFCRIEHGIYSFVILW